MSGTKYTEIVLAQKAALLLDVGNSISHALRTTQALQAQIEALIAEIEGIKVEDRAVDDRMKGHAGRLREEASSLDLRVSALQQLKLPESAAAATLEGLRVFGAQVSEMESSNGEVGKLAENLGSELVNLRTADKSIAAVEIGLDRARKGVELQDTLTRKWMPDEYAETTRKLESLEASFQDKRSSLESGAGTGAVVEELKCLESGLARLSDDSSKLYAEAERRQELQEKRLYILRALRSVCAGLGFQEVNKPSYEGGDVNTPVEQTFDTVNRGTITFKLYLNGRVESDSGISTDHCGEEFGNVSKMLADEFGIQTEFQRLGSDGLPERVTSSEKPIPRERKSGSAEGN